MYKEFIMEQCQKALLENEEYMNKEQSQETDADELQAIAEELCFIKGFSVASDLMLKLNALGNKGLSYEQVVNELLGGKA